MLRNLVLKTPSLRAPREIKKRCAYVFKDINRKIFKNTGSAKFSNVLNGPRGGILRAYFFLTQVFHVDLNIVFNFL